MSSQTIPAGVYLLCRETLRDFKVVDSCLIFSKIGSDTFKSVLIYGKQQESLKKIHNRAKNSPS